GNLVTSDRARARPKELRPSVAPPRGATSIVTEQPHGLPEYPRGVAGSYSPTPQPQRNTYAATANLRRERKARAGFVQRPPLSRRQRPPAGTPTTRESARGVPPGAPG